MSKNNKNLDTLGGSLMAINDGNKQWRFDFVKYLQNMTSLGKDYFFYHLMSMIRFVRIDDSSPGWTDRQLRIFLNAPFEDIPLDNKKWEFIYYHECLHQLFETFEVEDRIIKEKGVCNHRTLNIASDCVINDYIHSYYNLDYPAQGLISPEYLSQKYGVVYDKTTDNQYDLYMKLLEVWDKMKDDPIIRKACEDTPIVDLGDKTDSDGSNSKVKTKKIPTTAEWKAGSKAARDAANAILREYHKNAPTQANGKLSIDDTAEVLTRALAEIKKLIDNPIKEFFNMSVLNSQEFILEADSINDIDTRYTTYEQGWDYAIRDVIQQVENAIATLGRIGNPRMKPRSEGRTEDGTGDVQEIPENDPDEEDVFLPKVERKTKGSGSTRDSSDSNRDSSDSDRDPSDSDRDSSDSDRDSSDSDIDGMPGETAADKAQQYADEAQSAADEAQSAADKAKQTADETGTREDKQAADKAQQAADKAQQAADKAQQAADNAQEAAEKGDKTTAQNEAKKARNAAVNSRKYAYDAETQAAENQDAGDQDAGDQFADGVEWDEEKDTEQTDADKQLDDEIREYEANTIRPMSTEDAKHIIKQFAASSRNLKDFVKKCKSSTTEKDPSGVVFSTSATRNGSWAKAFSSSIRETVAQHVKNVRKEYKYTYSRPNRRQGIIRSGDVLKKGKIQIKDKVTISIAFYIDCSGSMAQDDITKIFEFVYKIDATLRKQYGNNSVVREFIFDYYKFTTSIIPVTPPSIPLPGGSTADLDVLIQAMINRSKEHMINVVITDGKMTVDVEKSVQQLSQLAGNVIYITNCTELTPYFGRIAKRLNTGSQHRGRKFEPIMISDFNIDASDFANLNK